MDPAQQFHLLNNPNLREPEMTNNLTWKKYYPLSDKNGFICLVDKMGDDSSIVQAARVSYGKDEQEPRNYVFYEGDENNKYYFEGKEYHWVGVGAAGVYDANGNYVQDREHEGVIQLSEYRKWKEEQGKKDRNLIRYLMNHQHTTPFEMVEFKFMVQVPMDCWRQWVRHRTASINEYSTRYTEAIDACQETLPGEWRLQATDNKQGSSGYLDEQLGMLLNVDEAMDLIQFHRDYMSYHKAGEILTKEETLFHKAARKLYELRLKLGIAKEQARKDLPLSTYTRAYWKCDLHNIFNFLRLRMDSHAQLEIRSYANCMYEIVKQVCPVACEAFEDYVLHAKRFSRMEMKEIRDIYKHFVDQGFNVKDHKPNSMTDREWKEFLEKIS